MVDNKVLIGISTAEYGRRADFYDYVNTLQVPSNAMKMTPHGPSIAYNRNMIIESAFQQGATHILFLDDDMAFKPDTLYKLLEHDKDIVSGLYLARKYPHQPMVFESAAKDGRCFAYYLNGAKERLVKVVAAGAGCLLVKTEVFKKVERPWFRLGELESDQWCDDIGFFKRVREAGITDIYCDMDVKVGHIASMIIWPANQDGKWLSMYDTGHGETVGVPQVGG